MNWFAIALMLMGIVGITMTLKYMLKVTMKELVGLIIPLALIVIFALILMAGFDLFMRG